MIVPVWLSSSRSNEEVLAYAILDTQSDATFILKEICDDRDVEMQPTKLQESLVDSHRITDLQVRGYSSDIQIPTPVAYTSTSITANESHIPTKTTAKKWRHLQEIQDEMPHMLDCNVGLLIGYDCPQALSPREVIAGKNNEQGSNLTFWSTSKVLLVRFFFTSKRRNLTSSFSMQPFSL